MHIPFKTTTGELKEYIEAFGAGFNRDFVLWGAKAYFQRHAFLALLDDQIDLARRYAAAYKEAETLYQEAKEENHV